MTTTKQKTTKRCEIHPPRDIRENLGARRAWLAAEADRLSTQPNAVVKVVGSGSYQHLVVYDVITVEARLQRRGTCQYCGGQQAVVSWRIALHGYTRPGDGWVTGRCPGTGEEPAEVSVDKARRFIDWALYGAEENERELRPLTVKMQENDELLDYGSGRLVPRRKLVVGVANADGPVAARRLKGISEATAAEARALRFWELTRQTEALRQQADYITSAVLPRHGQPLTEHLV